MQSIERQRVRKLNRESCLEASRTLDDLAKELTKLQERYPGNPRIQFDVDDDEFVFYVITERVENDEEFKRRTIAAEATRIRMEDYEKKQLQALIAKYGTNV